MKKVIIAIVIGIVVFEVIEHIIFPVYWSIAHRKKRSPIGASGMLGQIGIVKQWQGDEGQVLVSGELWAAVCDAPITAGDRVVIQEMRGLVLKVAPQASEIVET